MPAAARIDVTLEECYQLRKRLDQKLPVDRDWPLLIALVSNLIARQEAKQDRLLSKINALREAEAAAAAAAVCTQSHGDAVDANHDATDAEFFVEGDGTEGPNNAPQIGQNKDEETLPPAVTVGDDKGKKDKPNKGKPKGHGRNGSAAFTGAKDFFHTLAPGVVGSICPRCNCDRMTPHCDKTTIRIVGQPMFGAERHHGEQARCRTCGNVADALPARVHDGIGKAVTYHWSACALLIVLHYLYALPFKRIESLHKAWGIPFADANQWEISREAMNFLEPLYQALIIFAIRNVITLRMDDTGSVVLTIKQQIAAELAAAKALGIPEDKIRTGINASGFYIETPMGVVLLYFTGRHHAAEILRELLKHRPDDSEKIKKVTDGASKNFDAKLAERLVEGVCNAHAFLKFHDVKEQFPVEYAIVGAAYDKIYEVEETARTQKLSPEDRLKLHQKHSRPEMEKIRAMCDEKITSRSVEPRSPLWEPIHFFISQWPRLTKFLEIPGMPLDTNLCEQTLITVVRYLAASFNYRTARGAETGDRGMSLAATARASNIDPVAWLTDCLINRDDLARNPDYYFPWTYRERMKKGPSPPSNTSEAPHPVL